MKIIEAENLTFSKKENNNTFDDIKAIILPKEEYQKQIDDYTVKIWELEDRISKAIEYIEEKYEMILKDSIEDFLDHDERIEKKQILKILDILKGVDKE